MAQLIDKDAVLAEIDFEQELYKAFGHVKDFTLCLKIARRFYEMGRNYQEPVSDDLEKIVEEIAEPTILNAYGTKELARRLRNTICGTSVSKDLGDYINELSKQFPEVSFAKLSRIAVRVSRWQRNQDTKNKLPEVINRTDLDEYAYQCAYDMSNDWMIENPTWHDVENACKLGAKWQLNKIKEKYEENRD